MVEKSGKLTVFYDGACPSCIKDRRFYEYLAGSGRENIVWLDITNQEQHLIELGIEPFMAMTELHVQMENGEIRSELDAYIELMSRVWLMKPLVFILTLPFIRPFFSRIYHRRVLKRLKKAGRL